MATYFQAAQSRPYAGYKFIVIAAEGAIGGFQEISGLGSEFESIEYREGNLRSDVPAQFIGREMLSDVTLKRGMSDNSYLWDWRERVISEGDEAKQDIEIILANKEGEAVCKWTVKRCWPKSIEVDPMNAQSSDVLIETVVLAVEGLDFDPNPSENLTGGA